MNSYKSIPKGQKLLVMPPNAQGMMCGVRWAEQDRKGIITLIYSDYMKESVPASAPIKELESFENFFSLVDYVQSFRKTQDA